MNWIFRQEKSLWKLFFAGYTGSKNQVRNRLKIQFIKLDFSKLIFQKSSTDPFGYALLIFILKKALVYGFGNSET